MSTIIIKGRTFTVEQLPDADVHESNRPGYLLTGARGARYRTMRNQPRPHMLYLVNAKNWTMSAPQCWLTDKSGKLEVSS